MTDNMSTLTPLLGPLAALQSLLDIYPDRSIIIGGIASSLLGQPRLTADLDALILLSNEEIPELFENAVKKGLETRIAEAEEFAKRHRIVLLRHTKSETNIDISLGLLPFEQEAISHSHTQEVGGIVINLPTPEDLIVMKSVAHRPKDLLDIQGIIQSHRNLDRDYIQNWVQQFADLLERPELWDDIADWF